MARRTLALYALLAPGIAVGALSCDHDLPLLEFEELQPRGVIEGQVLYQGPPPCTEGGHVVGAAVLYLFHSDGLPPPEGLAPSVENFAALAGDVLFADYVSQLQFNADGSRWCAPEGTPNVTASGDFVISPISAGSFQIRAFYDLDGDYFPAFDYSNLATKGDINGGGILNIDEFFNGGSPKYRDIEIGTKNEQGEYVVPSEGVLLKNVTVGLGQPYTMQRPYMHYAGVVDEQYGNTDPNNIVMPADYWAKDFTLVGTEKSLLRVVFNAGVPDEEKAAAMAPPFNWHLDDPGKLMIYRFDFNGDGVVDDNDGIPETALVPALMPLMIWQKQGQSNPTVVNLGITFADDSLFGSVAFTSKEPVPYDHITVALRPAAICIDSSESPSQVTLVSPYEKDQNGVYIFGEDTSGLKGALAGLTGTVPENVEFIYTCMPPGDYGLNAIYTSGQVWMLPNEAGYCMPREEPKNPDASGQPTECGSRQRLNSQGITVRVGTIAHGRTPEATPDPSHCYEFASDELRERYKKTCLTPAERKLFDEQTLF
jgi:hypothetical protein